jgi:hypothetical protein
MLPRTSLEAFASRACSSAVYQAVLTAASCTTSSRLRPGVRRLEEPFGRPTFSGDSLVLRVFRKSARALRRFSSIIPRHRPSSLDLVPGIVRQPPLVASRATSDIGCIPAT